jgi:hypothetical protein
MNKARDRIWLPLLLRCVYVALRQYFAATGAAATTTGSAKR